MPITLGNKLCDITVELHHETPSAILVSDGKREAWLPKSQIEWTRLSQGGSAIEVTLPEWLAREKELI
jgi:hypothetical protein